MKAPIKMGGLTISPGRGRTKDQPMGRFGGGWQYKLGITAGNWTRKDGGTVLLALWSDEYRITWHPKGSRYRAAK